MPSARTVPRLEIQSCSNLSYTYTWKDKYAGMLMGAVAIRAGSKSSECPFLGYCYTLSIGFSTAMKKGDVYLCVPVIAYVLTDAIKKGHEYDSICFLGLP